MDRGPGGRGQGMMGGARARWARWIGQGHGGLVPGPGGRGSGTVGGARSRWAGPGAQWRDPGSAAQSAFFTGGSHAEAEPRVRVRRSAVVASPAGHERPALSPCTSRESIVRRDRPLPEAPAEEPGTSSAIRTHQLPTFINILTSKSAPPLCGLAARDLELN